MLKQNLYPAVPRHQQYEVQKHSEENLPRDWAVLEKERIYRLIPNKNGFTVILWQYTNLSAKKEFIQITFQVCNIR